MSGITAQPAIHPCRAGNTLLACGRRVWRVVCLLVGAAAAAAPTEGYSLTTKDRLLDRWLPLLEALVGDVWSVGGYDPQFGDGYYAGLEPLYVSLAQMFGDQVQSKYADAHALAAASCHLPTQLRGEGREAAVSGACGVVMLVKALGAESVLGARCVHLLGGKGTAGTPMLKACTRLGTDVFGKSPAELSATAGSHFAGMPVEDVARVQDASFAGLDLATIKEAYTLSLDTKEGGGQTTVFTMGTACAKFDCAVPEPTDAARVLEVTAAASEASSLASLTLMAKPIESCVVACQCDKEDMNPLFQNPVSMVM